MRKNLFKKATAVLTALCGIAAFSVFGAGAAVISNENSSVSAEQSEEVTVSYEALPSKYSSKGLGFVTDIKTQLYNECWAVSGISVFESKLLSEGIAVENMSFDHLNIWGTKRADGTGWQRKYNEGGYSHTALGYLTSWQGGVEIADCGVIDITSGITAEDLNLGLAKYGTTGVEYLDRNDPGAIKRAIMENGGVYGAYSTATSCINPNKTAFFMPESYSGSSVNHGVEIVGWNDTYSINNFTGSVGVKPKKQGAWLARNSYGDYNSLGGYFWISYEDKNIFADRFKPLYTIKSIQKIDESTRLKQNEIYGATIDVEIGGVSEAVFINRFDFSDGFNTLDKVIFETECKGADYTVYYVPDGPAEKPAEDKNKWTQLYKGTTDYKGYICADISDFMLPIGYGSIAVSVNTEQLNAGVPAFSADFKKPSLGSCEWVTNAETGNYVLLNNPRSGDSYVYYNNQMTDLLDWYEQELDDPLGGTLVIKAVTTNKGTEGALLGDVTLDGVVSVLDATQIQKYLAGSEDLSAVQKLNADVDGNGVISVTDATAIQKKIAGLL